MSPRIHPFLLLSVLFITMISCIRVSIPDVTDNVSVITESEMRPREKADISTDFERNIIQLASDASTGIDIPRDAKRVRYFVAMPSDWVAPDDSVAIEHAGYRIMLSLDSISMLDSDKCLKPIIKRCVNSKNSWIAVSYIEIEERIGSNLSLQARRIKDATCYLFTDKRYIRTKK